MRIAAHRCRPIFDIQPFQPKSIMNTKQWYHRTTTRRVQTEGKMEMSFLPENIGRITIRFQTDPPMLLRIQVGTRKAVMDTGTTMTEVQRTAAFPETG